MVVTSLPPPSPADQIRFLTDLQRLLSEGLFTATYKYALLAALADLSIEQGEEAEGGPLLLTTSALAEKFIEYYWRHAAPYATSMSAIVLRQNTGAQAKVIALIVEARRQHAGSLAEAMRDRAPWRRLIKSVEAVVKEQPLWKLQTVGREKLDFLYGPTPEGDRIELRPGVAYCFRQFYTFVQDAVRSAWLRDVRSLNGGLLGETLDLREFLFGAERSALNAVRPVLGDLQRGACFYCGNAIRGEGGHVDHFIPWAKYPIDLAHNFVLADSRCNGRKKDRIAHVSHLAKWTERNEKQGKDIETTLKSVIPCDLPCATRIAQWAYGQVEASHGLTWLKGDDLVALTPDWRECFRSETDFSPPLV